MAIFPLTRYTTHMGTSGLKLNFLIAGIATCAFWLFGYDMSVMVQSHSSLSDNTSSKNKYRAVSLPKSLLQRFFPK